jgi:hypothetical protein
VISAVIEGITVRVPDRDPFFASFASARQVFANGCRWLADKGYWPTQ